jgi:hypothetical protein
MASSTFRLARDLARHLPGPGNPALDIPPRVLASGT